MKIKVLKNIQAATFHAAKAYSDTIPEVMLALRRHRPKYTELPEIFFSATALKCRSRLCGPCTLCLDVQ